MTDRAVHASQARVCSAVAGEFGIASDAVLRIWRRCTELLAREARQDKRIERDRIIQSLREDPKTTLPTPERQQQGAGVEIVNPREASGQRRMVALDPVQHYLGRGWITPRQARAAQSYRNDYDLGIVGAKDPEMMGFSGSRRTSSYSVAQLAAVESYTAARDRLGPSFVYAVEQVVIYERTVRDLVMAKIEPDPETGEKREPSRGESDGMFWLFRAGLDILGDAYGEPAELVVETISADPIVRIIFRHEKNGQVSGITLNGRPWIANARNIHELKQRALSGAGDASQEGISAAEL